MNGEQLLSVLSHGENMLTISLEGLRRAQERASGRESGRQGVTT